VQGRVRSNSGRPELSWCPISFKSAILEIADQCIASHRN
jgi:hypothetical protein